MAGAGRHVQERFIDGERISRTETGVGAGDDSPVRLDKQSERPVLDGAAGVARQRVSQHRGKLRPGIENDGYATDHVPLLRRPYRRPIDVSRAGRVERAGDER